MSCRKAIFNFSIENKPAYTVMSMERVIVVTRDCFSGKARSSKHLFEDVGMGEVNPATRPIRVEGVLVGDALCVSIERIKCGKKEVIMCSPNLGILRDDVRRSRTRIVDVRGNKAWVSEDLEIEISPHVGVVGVSPSKGSFPTFHCGDFGGNMDTVEMGEGSKIYLPTFVSGGMVAVGDVHAAMGEGEICGTGVEVPAEVTVTLSNAEELSLKRPMIEMATEWITYAAAETLDEAASLAASAWSGSSRTCEG
ncbi:MAG: acetamidase/formamidase family protein [Thermoplasmata archaeon]